MPLPILGSILMGAARSAGVLAGAAGSSTMPAIGMQAAKASGGAISSTKQSLALKSIIEGPVKQTKHIAQMASKKAGLLGISLGVGSLLKQSQLFTGFVGAFFQIIGAFIDVLLAPLMPILFKGLVWIAKGIPYLQRAIDGVIGWVTRIWKMSDSFSEFLLRMVASLIAKIVGFLTSAKTWVGLGKAILGVFKLGLKAVWSLSIYSVATKFGPVIVKKLWELLPDSITGPISDMAGHVLNIWNWVTGIFEKIKTWLELKVLKTVELILTGLNAIKFVNLDSTLADVSKSIAKLENKQTMASKDNAPTVNVVITVENPGGLNPMEQAFHNSPGEKMSIGVSPGHPAYGSNSPITDIG